MRAFSVGWPYVAFSQNMNYILLINAFDKKVMHRIEISAEKDSKMTILDSIIADTYDLFIFTEEINNSGHHFKLYMLDLDETDPDKEGYFN
jgi:hypothetical protein